MLSELREAGARSSFADHGSWYIVLGIAVGLMAIIITVSWWRERHSSSKPVPTPWRLMLIYLTVYLCCTAGDWLQGPYVYALYESCHYDISMIGYLFIVGFGTSAVFGTFIGSLGDKFGRKKLVILYCVLYILSCFTKHFCDLGVLFIGRILGGIATSLLFSVFEAWLVSEHTNRGYHPESLGKIFSVAYFLNPLVAIVCGVVANVALDELNYIAVPFDFATGFLIAGLFGAIILWPENYGDQTQNMSGQWKGAMTALFEDKYIWRVGIIQSFFESAMYIFVFMWTPTLTNALGSGDIKNILGIVFATFMTCAMIGSTIFSLISSFGASVHKIVTATLLVACIGLLVPACDGTNSTGVIIGFLVFEVSVGVYFPSVGMLKSQFVPEETRATFYNIFRIPLNVIVVLVLVLVKYMSPEAPFIVCTVLLACCFVLSISIPDSRHSYDTLS